MRRKNLAFSAILISIPGLVFAAPHDGWYGGFSAAYNIGDGTLTIPAYVPSTYQLDPDGVGVGGFGGYNFPSSGVLVFGIEAGVHLLNTSDSVATAVPGETFSVDGNWEASIVARAGGTAGSFSIYGLGGATIMDLSGQYTGGFASQSDSQVGWTVGFGAERELPGGGFVRGEVR